MAAFLKRALNDAYRQVADLKVKELIERRHARLNSYGRFNDTKADKSDKSDKALGDGDGTSASGRHAKSDRR
jgi:hypothetical protein